MALRAKRMVITRPSGQQEEAVAPVLEEGGGSGENGGYYIPSVSEDGTLSWQPSKGGMEEVPSSNIKYILTDADRDQIADSVLARIPVYDGTVI